MVVMFDEVRSFTTSILLFVVEEGELTGEIVLVLTPGKDKPLYWKLPGGRCKFGEIPETTALWELQEETGVVLEPGNLAFLEKQKETDHDKYFFASIIEKGQLLPQLKKHLAERTQFEEYVKVFSLQKVIAMERFLPGHRKFLKSHKVLQVLESLGLPEAA